MSGVSTFAPDISKGFNLLVFLFVPGYYIAVVLGKIMELGLDEILTVDIIVSAAMAMFVSVYLSFSFLQITEVEMGGGVFLVTVLSGLLLLPQLQKPDKLRGEKSLSSSLKAVGGLLVSFLIGFILIMRVIPESYWLGWDPWLNTPVAGTILEEGLNPFELSSRYAGVANVGISGFYYFLAAIQAFTRIDLYSISRFGGPVLAGMASMITYLVVRRLEGVGAGLSASFFLFLNPFFVKRFSMALRENLGFVFFLGILFLSITRGESFDRNWPPRLCFSFVLSLFLAVSLSVHSLVPIIAYGVVVLEIVFCFLKTGHVPVELILALFLSFLLAAPYLLPSMLTYIWTIRNWFSLSLESFFFISTGAIALIIFLFYSGMRTFKSAGRYWRKVLILMTILLFVGAVYSIVFPKNFPILGSYNPHITLGMFAISSLLLACLGSLTVLKSSVPIGITSLSLLLILIPNLTNVNVAFPLFRLAIYISWLLAYGAAKFFKFVYDRHRSFELKFPIHFSFWKRKIEISNLQASLLVCVTLLTLLSPVIIMDLQAVSRSWTYHNQEDVNSALSFLNLLEENDIVVPQGWTQDLLIYAGIDLSTMISNGTMLQGLYSASTLENFSQIILSRYPNASRAQVFTIERRAGNENYPTPSPELLELWGEKHQLGSTVYYTVPLSYTEKELLESSIHVQLPAGSQWVYINITGTDLSNGGILALRIINNNNASKTFFAKIQDIHGNSTEQILFTLQPGDKKYYIRLTEIEEVVDLRNPATLTLCFSWYGWEPSIDLIISNMTLMILKN